MKPGILDAITLMAKENEGMDDKFTYHYIKKVKEAMEQKKRKSWPSKELRIMVNGFDDLSRKYFLDTINDMKKGLDEHYGDWT